MDPGPGALAQLELEGATLVVGVAEALLVRLTIWNLDSVTGLGWWEWLPPNLVTLRVVKSLQLVGVYIFGE